MKKILTLFVLTNILFLSYYYQIDYYADKYFNHYLSDETGFSINQSIVDAKKKKYEKKLASLKKTVVELQDKFQNHTQGSALISDLNLAMKGKNTSILDRHKNTTSPEFIESVKKVISEEDKVSGDIRAFAKIAKEQANETARKLTLLTSEYREESREKKKLLLDLSDFQYFSVVTSTTTGYGDITPITNEVRLLIKNQVIISLILIGLLISVISLFFTEILNIIFKERKGH